MHIFRKEGRLTKIKLKKEPARARLAVYQGTVQAEEWHFKCDNMELEACKQVKGIRFTLGYASQWDNEW